MWRYYTIEEITWSGDNASIRGRRPLGIAIPYHRVTVVLSGDLLNIEFRDGGATQPCKITAGEVDWSEPSDRVHRAVNVGQQMFEEVVTFFLDRSDAVPQPEEG
jgi:hypothetical protein